MYLLLLLFLLQTYISNVLAYKPLADTFLANISSKVPDLDLSNGGLLSPILQLRPTGSPGHAAVQAHFVRTFNQLLPKWTLEWQNSTARNLNDREEAVENLIFSREPPWTRPGQANFLTFAAHYDSEVQHINAADGAVPCALLLHIAHSVDAYMTQMHEEMSALGEGGTEDMDMGVRMVFLDGKYSAGEEQPVFFGSKALSQAWEVQHNPGIQFANSLSQVRMLIVLDTLGNAQPRVPSYLATTQWLHKKLSILEDRLQNIQQLGLRPPSTPFLDNNGTTHQMTLKSDCSAFSERGVSYLQIQPLQNSTLTKVPDTTDQLDMDTIHKWARLLEALALEWLDMMEVWPE